MEMQQVRYFVALAQTLNFTRAAEHCNVSQPALTRAIQQILGLTERLLGMSGEPSAFSAQDVTEARAQVALWRQQVDALTMHVAGLTMQPPDRPQ